MVSSMIYKSLKTVAMIAVLAAVGSISFGMASDESTSDLTALSGPDGETMAGVVNGTNNVSNNASNNESVTSPNMTNQTSAEDLNASVVELSTLDNASETKEGAETTALSSSSTEAEEAEVEVIGAGAGAIEPADLEALGGALEASAAGNAADLSSLGEGTEVTSTTSSTGPMDVAALGEGLNTSADNAADLSTLGEETAVASTTNLIEPIDVRVLGNVLIAPPAENVKDLSTLGNVTAAEPANATKTGFASLSNATTEGMESTDVKDLSAALGIEF